MKLKLTIKNVKNLLPAEKPYEVLDEDIKGFLLRVQPSGAMTYYLSYRTIHGIKKGYRIGSQSSLTPEQARDIAKKLTSKHLSGIDVQEEKKQNRRLQEKNKFCLFGEFLESKFNSWVISQRKAGKYTIRGLKLHFNDFLGMPMQQITHWLIDHWRSQQLKANKKPITLNRIISDLRGCFSKAVEWGILETHPLAKLKPLKIDNNPKVRYLSEEEENRLRKAIDDRELEIKLARKSGNEWRLARGHAPHPDLQSYAFVDYLQPMIILSMNTGLRQGELFNLKWQTDIDFDRAVLTVNGETAKSKKTRHIPLNKESFSVLKKWRYQTVGEDFVFPGKEGKKFNNIRKSWASLLSKANIQKFRWHDLRHHFASRLAMAGVDLNTIRELLGHSDLTMTLRYAHLAPEHTAAAVAKLDNSSNQQVKSQKVSI